MNMVAATLQIVSTGALIVIAVAHAYFAKTIYEDRNKE